MTLPFDLRHVRQEGLPPFDLSQFKKKDKRPTIDELLHCEKPMTVCIAMMARDAKTKFPAIVFAVDRQKTNAIIKFEDTTSKFQGIGDYAGILMAADEISISYEITSEVMATISNDLSFGKKIPIKDIAEIVSKKCLERYQQEFQREVLSAWGLTYEKINRDLSPDNLRLISDEFRRFDYDFKGGAFIVFGIDECPTPTAHIFYINEKGRILSRDAEGYAMIGNGQHHAFIEFTRCKCITKPCLCAYHRDRELSEVIIRVYDAKRAAERKSEGVGESTHMGIVRVLDDGRVNGFTLFVDSPIHDILDNGRNDIRRFERESNQKTMQELNKELSRINYVPQDQF